MQDRGGRLAKRAELNSLSVTGRSGDMLAPLSICRDQRWRHPTLISPVQRDSGHVVVCRFFFERSNERPRSKI